MPREIHGQAKVFDWLGRPTESERREGLLRWVELVAIDPDFVTTGVLVHPRTGRHLNYSDVPAA